MWSDHLKTIQRVQRGSEIRPFEIWKYLKSGLFEGQISNGPVFKWSSFGYGYSSSPNHLQTRPFKIRTLLSGFQFFWQMVAICLGFKCLGIWILDPSQNPDRLQTQPLFDHLKSIVQISDPHCIQKVECSDFGCSAFRWLLCLVQYLSV